jgi:hypothetical protein
MSTPALILWILVALLFVAACYGVYRASRSTIRKSGVLGRELGGLAADLDDNVRLRQPEQSRHE